MRNSGLKPLSLHLRHLKKNRRDKRLVQSSRLQQHAEKRRRPIPLRTKLRVRARGILVLLRGCHFSLSVSLQQKRSDRAANQTSNPCAHNKQRSLDETDANPRARVEIHGLDLRRMVRWPVQTTAKKKGEERKRKKKKTWNMTPRV